MTSATLARTWARSFEPPPVLSVSQWAAEHRRLPQTSAAQGGRWDNATCPYLTEILDAAIAPGIHQITVCKAAQIGMSEALLTIVGYLIEHRPAPVLMVLPTIHAAQSWSKERLADCIRSTPSLQRLVTDKRVPASAGLPESTLNLKMFPSGFLALAGGNSVNSFARWSVRVAIADDADRIPKHVGAEGDATQLLINRTTSYHDALAIFVSTPVLSDGRIETLYGQSDRRRYFVTCPACGRADYITWSNRERWYVAFDERTPSTARLQCRCGRAVHERDRMALIRAGEWRPTAEPLAPGHRGYHAPAMLSPFVSLEQLTTKFLSAHVSHSARRLKEFCTTQLAEGWRDPATAIDPSDLVSRMEDF